MPDSLLRGLAYYVFAYPVAMSVVWISAGLRFWRARERKASAPASSAWPPVTILVPCHDEEAAIGATCDSLRRLDYPNYRVVFVDDASADATAQTIREYAARVPFFHLLRLTRNQGKAMALNWGLETAVTTPIVTVIDADTHLAPDALKWMVAPFFRQPRLAAVTANPLVRNRSNLLEKFQAVEFASIIGLIKRSHRVLGRVFTVSGCATAYRTSALRRVGGFSPDTATEDINITWKIQKAFLEVWFAPQAISYIQVPSRLGDLWQQRKRWALGGWHLLRDHWNVFTRWRWRRLWPVQLDFMLGCLWAFCFVFGTVFWLAGAQAPFSPFPAWNGAVVSFVCLVQFAVALVVSHRYDKKLWRCFFWVPWYPLAVFALAAVAVVWTAPSGLFGRRSGRSGMWRSPARRLSHPGGRDDAAEPASRRAFFP